MPFGSCRGLATGSGVKPSIWRSAGHGPPQIFSMLSSGRGDSFPSIRCPVRLGSFRRLDGLLSGYISSRIGSGAAPSKSSRSATAANTTHDSPGNKGTISPDRGGAAAVMQSATIGDRHDDDDLVRPRRVGD